MMHKKSPRSLFFHLVFILTLTAISVIVIVFGFFHAMRRDAMNKPLRVHLNQYAGYIARDIGEPPDIKKMEELGRKLQLEIIYKPHAAGKPRHYRNDSSKTRNYFFRKFHKHDAVISNREGWVPGQYIKKYHGKKGDFLFVVNAPDSLSVIPRPVIILILVLMVAFFVAWLILRNLVLPLKRMEDAFARAAQGDLSSRLDLKHPRELLSIGRGFNVMLDNLHKMLEGRKQMLRDVSHDLRTPLTRIKLNLGFLRKSKDKLAIEEDVRIMEKLLSDILDTYRFSEGPVKLKLTGIDVNKLTRKLVKVFSNSNPQIKFKTGFQAKAPGIQGDENQVTRLFSNLVENAVTHSPPGGDIHIDIYSETDCLVWEIRDEGKSIPAEFHEKIFQPFFQIESARDPARAGYGLGLYICRSIAEQHGGSIEYRPGEKRGSVFTVRLRKENPEI